MSHAGNDTVLFSSALDEYAPDALQTLTAMAYRRLFAAARAWATRTLLRVWNYFPRHQPGMRWLERYRRFAPAGIRRWWRN